MTGITEQFNDAAQGTFVVVEDEDAIWQFHEGWERPEPDWVAGRGRKIGTATVNERSAAIFRPCTEGHRDLVIAMTLVDGRTWEGRRREDATNHAVEPRLLDRERARDRRAHR